MPEVPEELDVFRLAHGHMKQLVKDMDKELLCTNFGDASSLLVLLDHLNSRFSEFKTHEEIENQYIVRELLPRLPSDAKTTLENDIHSDNRLSELVRLVSDGLDCEFSSEADRLDYGNRLKSAIANFTVDFIPHMNEEEEVFLPLLVEHFSESELRQLTRTVNELHHLGPQQDDNCDKASKPRPSDPTLGSAPSGPSPLLQLPPEVLLSILSYLSPSQLLSLSHLHSKLNALAFDGSLWQHLHPVRWAQGHKEFYQPLVVGGEEGDGGGGGGGGGACQDAIVENDVIKELLSVGGKVNANSAKFRASDPEEEEERAMEREMSVLCGVIEHLLPRVGAHVRTLDLAYGKAVTNEVVFRMLRQCPNLHHLDLSHTKVSDFAFKGLLSRGHQLWQLEYLDLSGCSLVTDSALQRIAQALSSPSHHHYPPPPHHTPPLPPNPRHCCEAGGCGMVMGYGGRRVRVGDPGGGGVVVGGASGRKRKVPQLKCLILSGCYHLTDEGLRSLSGRGSGTISNGGGGSGGIGLPHLCYLDLSGLPNITQSGLSGLVSVCPQLQPETLFYCDNIPYGPYSGCANGCQNVGSTSLVCCRQMM